MIQYLPPDNWIKYDPSKLIDVLTEAKAAVLSLQTVPYQKRWVDALQAIELKREIAGTSRIEGAEFTTRELDRAMKEETPDELFTRSQRQAAAAKRAYAWLQHQPVDRPVDVDLILSIHRLMVKDADDDHCDPGATRKNGLNVTFGTPPHRGIEGGEACTEALASLVAAINNEFKAHDPMIQAIAAHRHLAAMHPFLDGNGRTARALEAFMLRKAQARETMFIGLSNYYYDEKVGYLTTLAAVREEQNDLTPFLRFALRGVSLQAKRLLVEIQREISRELFRTLAHDLFGRLRSPRRRVIAERQIKVLEILLSRETMPVEEFVSAVLPTYRPMKSGGTALGRDMAVLLGLGAVNWDKDKIWAELKWPERITETEFFKQVQKMPKASTNWIR